MGARRAGGVVAVALGLALVATAPRGAAPPVLLDGVQPIAATNSHAAIVIDTGTGAPKKYCLIFPEESISGIEALRRIDAGPSRFESFGDDNEAVCMLCGVGCATGKCFCNPDRYWAYHRAGPGGAKYETSRVGASRTAVRNGDVEGWKWGAGEAPPPATVGEVCDIPEPPARTASASPTSTTTTGAPTTTTTAASAAAPSEPPPATTIPGAPPPSVAAGAPPGTGAGGAPPAGAPTPPPGPVSVGDAPEGPAGGAGAAESEPAGDGDAATERTAGDGGEVAGAPGPSGDRGANAAFGGPVAGVAFVALLGGVLVWRRRLRGVDVRSRQGVR